jgi:hypothetical protein
MGGEVIPLTTRKRIEAQGFVDLDDVTLGQINYWLRLFPGGLHGMGGRRDGPVGQYAARLCTLAPVPDASVQSGCQCSV